MVIKKINFPCGLKSAASIKAAGSNPQRSNQIVHDLQTAASRGLKTPTYGPGWRVDTRHKTNQRRETGPAMARYRMTHITK